MSNAQDKRSVSVPEDNDEPSIELQSMQLQGEGSKHEHSTEGNVDRENLTSDQVSHEEEHIADNKMISESKSSKAAGHITRERLSTRTKLWLLSSKGIWFILGSMLVVIAGLVSHFESKALPANNCTNTTTGNYTL